MPLRSRKTKQKELLEKELTNTSSFFTADDLFALIEKKDSSIGIATIYRFLKQKSELGELHSYRCGSKLLYSVEKRNHSHFICNQCGQTSHMDIKDIGTIRDSVKGEMCHFQLDVYGICERCRRIEV
jgi:Fe2+ or Zn2+ uptake regulation protein